MNGVRVFSLDERFAGFLRALLTSLDKCRRWITKLDVQPCESISGSGEGTELAEIDSYAVFHLVSRAGAAIAVYMYNVDLTFKTQCLKPAAK